MLPLPHSARWSVICVFRMHPESDDILNPPLLPPWSESLSSHGWVLAIVFQQVSLFFSHAASLLACFPKERQGAPGHGSSLPRSPAVAPISLGTNRTWNLCTGSTSTLHPCSSTPATVASQPFHKPQTLKPQNLCNCPLGKRELRLAICSVFAQMSLSQGCLYDHAN